MWAFLKNVTLWMRFLSHSSIIIHFFGCPTVVRITYQQTLWNVFNSYICDKQFFIWVFFHEHSRFTGQQGRGEVISLTPLYHFHLLHRHLDISWVITAESSPLHIARSHTQTGNLWFPSASKEKDCSVSIHVRNIKVLPIQMFKVSKNLAPSQMHEVFKLKGNLDNLRYNSLFSRPIVKLVCKGMESLLFLRTKKFNLRLILWKPFVN